MSELALYYKEIEKNYELMKKYYLMAIEKENSTAMFELGLYYEDIEINHKLMKKYYLRAIDKGNSSAINKLLKYYYKNLNENIYDEFFLTFINIENEELQKKLSPSFKFIKKLYNEKIDLMKLHFEYSLNNKGFEEAKKDFINLLQNYSIKN